MTPDERLAHARAAVAAAEARGETWQGWTEQERTEVNMGYQREPDPARAHAEAESMRRIAAMPFNRGRTWTSGSALNVETKAMSGDKGSHESVAHGVYRVRWNDADGVSLAAIGSGPGGERWIAPTNWLRPGLLATCWTEIKSLERIDVGGPDEVECSDATARDETNRQLREAREIAEGLTRERDEARRGRDDAAIERDHYRRLVARERSDRLAVAKERDEARRDYELERKAHNDTIKALADERAAHKDMKAQLLAEVKAAWTVALPEGAFSERARLTYEGAKWVMDAMSGVDHTFASAVPIAVERANALLRAAEAEAAKGASGEGGA